MRAHITAPTIFLPIPGWIELICSNMMTGGSYFCASRIATPEASKQSGVVINFGDVEATISQNPASYFVALICNSSA